MVPGRPSLVAALTVAAAIGAGRVAASTGERAAILNPVGGERLVPGQTVDLRWTSLPPRVDEFEVLLSLDGGRHYPVRLTPQLDPSLGGLAWTVPNLPTDQARLRLRWGCDGVELEGPESTVFSIGSRDGQPMQAARYRDGEWWLHLGGAATAIDPHSESLTTVALRQPPDSAVSDQGPDDRPMRRGRARPGFDVPAERMTVLETRGSEVEHQARYVPLRR